MAGPYLPYFFLVNSLLRLVKAGKKKNKQSNKHSPCETHQNILLNCLYEKQASKFFFNCP